ncbi:MAG: hypothetical protein HLX48_01065 [Halomonas sp.]|uniref:hypothetical protein n=1 Tax=Halomonas sp. TaxID=1486246 RepID=UPI001805486C|nr:hypothetical protein [Halomonas sp.]NWN81574.1 hypothetical protein [Halomonas sp.]
MNKLKEVSGRGMLDIKSMIISRPQNSTLGFRLRDVTLNLVTLAIWGLFLIKLYVITFSNDSVWRNSFGQAIFVLMITFFAIFCVIYLWVNIEKNGARRRVSKYASGNTGLLISYNDPPEASHWHGRWQDKWLADFQAQTNRFRANRKPVNDSEHTGYDFVERKRQQQV